MRCVGLESAVGAQGLALSSTGDTPRPAARTAHSRWVVRRARHPARPAAPASPRAVLELQGHLLAASPLLTHSLLPTPELAGFAPTPASHRTPGASAHPAWLQSSRHHPTKPRRQVAKRTDRVRAWGPDTQGWRPALPFTSSGGGDAAPARSPEALWQAAGKAHLLPWRTALSPVPLGTALCPRRLPNPSLPRRGAVYSQPMMVTDWWHLKKGSPPCHPRNWEPAETSGAVTGLRPLCTAMPPPLPKGASP